MVGAKWRDRIGPSSILLGSALILTAAIPAATAYVSRTAAPAIVCPASPAKAARAVQRPGSVNDFNARAETRVTARGELIGRVLRLARGQEPPIVVPLPPESFIAESTGEALVYTRSGGGTGSEVHVVNVRTGCDTIVARPPEIARSAILAADGSAVYAHSVTRAGRKDAGVERHDLATGAVTQAVPALIPSAELGPVFATELRWALERGSLTVQSCGFARCTSRILDIATSELATVGGHNQGALIATTGQSLITFATCPGRPCPVLSFDIETGTSQTLADEAFGASIDTRPDGSAVLVIIADQQTQEVAL